MKIYNKSIYLFFASLLVISCTNNKTTETKPTLSVSVEPQKYFLDTLVGNIYDVNTVIPLGSNPEAYDPSPSQMVKVGKSKIYFKIGNLGFENTWLKNIKYNNPNMLIVDCSEGIETGEHNHEGEHSHPNGDPHIWSSTNTAKIVAKNMYNSLVDIDNKNADLYSENYSKIERKILDTDSIIKAYIAKAPSKSFIIYHPSLTYFAEEYGLNQLPIEINGKTPTPKQLTELIEKAKKENVKVVFIQAEFDKKNAEVVAQEIGAKIVTINPLVYQWDLEMVNIAKAIAQEYE